MEKTQLILSETEIKEALTVYVYNKYNREFIFNHWVDYESPNGAVFYKKKR